MMLNPLAIVLGMMIPIIHAQYYHQQSDWRMQPQFQQQQQYFLAPRQQPQAFFQQPQAFVTTRRQATEPISAVALMQGQNVTGIVQFSQISGTTNVQVSGRLSGLEPGEHGFHVHQFGDSRQGCKSMGGHFNPDGNNHGAPSDQFRHAGDLGNILANQNGEAEFNFIDPRISLEGPYSILGRGVVVHAKQDDLGRGMVEESRKTGNAGGRVACGIVALVEAK